MAQYFNINPTAGTESTLIRVTPLHTNNTHSDRTNEIKISNGVTTKTVVVTQYGVPNFVLAQGSGNVPFTGAVLKYQMTSHYQFSFESVPFWISITDEVGNIYMSNTQYSAPTDGETLFTLTVAPNLSSTSRISSNFQFAFNGGGTTLYIPISIFQAAQPQSNYLVVTPNPLYLDAYAATETIEVQSNMSWNIEDDGAMTYSLYGGDGDASVDITSIINNTGEYLVSSADFIGEDDTDVPFQVIQYPMPTIVADGAISYSVPTDGGAKSFILDSKYPWFIPSYGHITFYAKDTNGIETEVPTSKDNALSAGEYILTAIWSRNNGTTARTSTIVPYYRDLHNTARASENGIGPFTQQASSEYIEVTEDDITILASGTTDKWIGVWSSEPWSATCSSDWIQQGSGWESEGGYEELFFSVDPNFDSTREATIHIEGESGVFVNITISQSWDNPYVNLNQAGCLNYMTGSRVCEACETPMNACPVLRFTWVGDLPYIADLRNCVKCGACYRSNIIGQSIRTACPMFGDAYSYSLYPKDVEEV